ncbi:30S ribosomal protein S4 [Candidatus Falkowbacteria bacterium]|nr:30S ribosomal protein S4 [Candidatus Falkowbacteria bacterium]
MGRYLGPKHKKCRRLGVKICDSANCPMLKRNYPPGVHGVKGRNKLTGYGEQLAQKQMAKAIYGIMERQFNKYYVEAIRQSGDASENLMRQLELRLDNVIYRLGFAMTRAQARQFASHGLFTVNDTRVDVPSYQLRPGDVVGLRQRARRSAAFATVNERLKTVQAPSWLSMDSSALQGKVLDRPALKETQLLFDIKTIIEFYSK